MIVFERDEYNQYFISVEQTITLECTDICTVICLLIASHCLFNLSYHSKVGDILTFLQEKVICIPTEIVGGSKGKTKKKSTYKEGSYAPVSKSHINGILRV